MRILHYLGSRNLPHNPDEQGAGGTTRVALELARTQKLRGHDVTVVTTARQAWRTTWQGVHLAAVRSIPWPATRHSVGAFNARTHPPLVRLAFSQRFDVIHGHEHPYLRFVRAGLRIAHVHNNPFWTEHHSEQWSYQRPEFRALQQHCDVRLAVSHYVARQLEKGTQAVLPATPRASARGTAVVHNAVDLSRFKAAREAGSRGTVRRSLGISDDEVVFFFAGAVAPEKGVAHLAHAFTSLSADVPRVRLILAGGAALWGNAFAAARPKDRAYETEVQDILETRVRDGRVHSLGLVAAARMPDVYAASDVFVLPSLNEACPLVILEALASSLPIIASNVGGIPELTSPENSILVPPEDGQALAQAMRTLVDRPELRASFAKSALASAHTKTWELAAEQMDQVYATSFDARQRARQT